MYRDNTKTVRIGNAVIGGGNPILIQSMTNTPTEDVRATVAQILELEKAGCDIIRCTVPNRQAADAIAEIKKQIQERGITENLITVLNGQSRINIKLRGQQETEINGMGPDIEKEHIQQLLKKLSVLSPGDYLILAGSVPMKINDTIYYDILKTLDKKGIKAVVDTTGDLLLNVLKYHPFLIKPNIHELSELFSTEIKTKEDVVQYGLKLQDMGAQNVIVSMAGDGAVFICENGEIYKSEAPKGVVKNSVGAGDSMVAGFLAGFCETKDFAKAFKMGVCTGSASAFSEDLATKEQVRQVMDAHSFDF